MSAGISKRQHVDVAGAIFLTWLAFSHTVRRPGNVTLALFSEDNTISARAAQHAFLVVGNTLCTAAESSRA
jgi:hypothetical protein